MSKVESALLMAVRDNLVHASPLASGDLLTIFRVPWLVEASLISVFIFTCMCLCPNLPFLHGHHTSWSRGPAYLSMSVTSS